MIIEILEILLYQIEKNLIKNYYQLGADILKKKII